MSSTKILDTQIAPQASPADDEESQMKVTRSMEVVIIVACGFVFLMFAVLVIRYIQNGHGYSSMDRNQRAAEADSNSNEDQESEPVLFIEARSDRSFNDPSWASSADFPVVIVSVGEDGKASLGYMEEHDVATELVRRDGDDADGAEEQP